MICIPLISFFLANKTLNRTGIPEHLLQTGCTVVILIRLNNKLIARQISSGEQSPAASTLYLQTHCLVLEIPKIFTGIFQLELFSTFVGLGLGVVVVGDEDEDCPPPPPPNPPPYAG